MNKQKPVTTDNEGNPSNIYSSTSCHEVLIQSVEWLKMKESFPINKKVGSFCGTSEGWPEPQRRGSRPTRRFSHCGLLGSTGPEQHHSAKVESLAQPGIKCVDSTHRRILVTQSEVLYDCKTHRQILTFLHVVLVHKHGCITTSLVTQPTEEDERRYTSCCS